MVKLNLQSQTIQKLTQLIYPQNGSVYNFLGYALNLEAGTLSDKLNSNSIRDTSEKHIQIFAALLGHYALANPTPLSCKLVKFKDIPDGYLTKVLLFKEQFNQSLRFSAKNQRSCLKLQDC